MQINDKMSVMNILTGVCKKVTKFNILLAAFKNAFLGWRLDEKCRCLVVLSMKGYLKRL